MNDTTRTPAQSRTWRTHNAVEMDRAVISTSAHTVTLTRTASGILAEVDGEAADLARAVALLEDAYRVEVLAEVLAPLPAPVIGKARAARLHRLLGRLGLHEHYGLAARATGRPVYSLAALTEGEARQVWAYVVNLFPFAGQVAA